jgi:copper chaperone CopZ
MIRMSIPDMSCAHCQARVEAALAALPGTAQVTVDLVGRTADVAGIAPEADIVLALAEAGYPATVVGRN